MLVNGQVWVRRVSTSRTKFPPLTDASRNAFAIANEGSPKESFELLGINVMIKRFQVMPRRDK